MAWSSRLVVGNYGFLQPLRDPGNILGMVGGGNPFVAAGIIPKTGLTFGSKLAIGAGAGTAVGLGYALSQGLSQTISQKAAASAPTAYNFYQTKGGGPFNVSGLSGGTAGVEQNAEQTKTDMSSLLVIAVVAIGALMLFRK